MKLSGVDAVVVGGCAADAGDTGAGGVVKIFNHRGHRGHGGESVVVIETVPAVGVERRRRCRWMTEAAGVAVAVRDITDVGAALHPFGDELIGGVGVLNHGVR